MSNILSAGVTSALISFWCTESHAQGPSYDRTLEIIDKYASPTQVTEIAHCEFGLVDTSDSSYQLGLTHDGYTLYAGNIQSAQNYGGSLVINCWGLCLSGAAGGSVPSAYFTVEAASLLAKAFTHLRNLCAAGPSDDDSHAFDQ
jgi:hypothetical protein